VLPQSWPMFFEKIDIAWEGNSLKSREYLRSWNTSQTEGLYFDPKRISHSSSRYLISYNSWLSFITTHNRSNIWIMNDLLFSNQNITPRFVRCSSFPNILMILTIYLLHYINSFEKHPSWPWQHYYWFKSAGDCQVLGEGCTWFIHFIGLIFSWWCSMWQI